MISLQSKAIAGGHFLRMVRMSSTERQPAGIIASMNNGLPFKAVLWDMDGVIVDTFDGHYCAWKKTFEASTSSSTDEQASVLNASP